MKKLLVLFVLLVAAAVAAVLLLQNPLGKLVKLGIEEFGPAMTQASVRVGSVEISATDGHGTLTGLVLGNPRGFKTDYALKAGTIELVIEPASLTRDVVVIHKILIDAPQIIYEKNGNVTNFDVIQRNVEKYLGVKGGKSGKEAGKKLIIGSFVIRNARVNYNGMLDLKLPDIELRNIGKRSGGATSAQVTRAVINELNAKLALALAKTAVIGGIGGVVVGAGVAVKSLFGD